MTDTEADRARVQALIDIGEPESFYVEILRALLAAWTERDVLSARVSVAESVVMDIGAALEPIVERDRQGDDLNGAHTLSARVADYPRHIRQIGAERNEAIAKLAQQRAGIVDAIRKRAISLAFANNNISGVLRAIADEIEQAGRRDPAEGDPNAG